MTDELAPTPAPETVESKLARLANLSAFADLLRLDYDAKRNAIIPPEVVEELAGLESEFSPRMTTAAEKIAELREEIIRDVVAAGQSVKSAGYQVVYRKGSTTWDTAALTGYAAAHPEIDKFRKVGKPSASVQAAEVK